MNSSNLLLLKEINLSYRCIDDLKVTLLPHMIMISPYLRWSSGFLCWWMFIVPKVGFICIYLFSTFHWIFLLFIFLILVGTELPLCMIVTLSWNANLFSGLKFSIRSFVSLYFLQRFLGCIET